MGRAVDPLVYLVAPAQRELVELLERGEVASLEEVLPDELDGVLHLPLRLGSVGVAQPRGERVVGGEVQEERVELALGDEVGPSQDDRLEVVVEDLLREPSQVVEGVLVAAEERRSGEVSDELDVLGQRVAQGEEEGGQRTALAVDLDMAEHGPVDLGLESRRGLVAVDGGDLAGFARGRT